MAGIGISDNSENVTPHSLLVCGLKSADDLDISDGPVRASAASVTTHMPIIVFCSRPSASQGLIYNYNNTVVCDFYTAHFPFNFCNQLSIFAGSILPEMGTCPNIRQRESDVAGNHRMDRKRDRQEITM